MCQPSWGAPGYILRSHDMLSIQNIQGPAPTHANGVSADRSRPGGQLWAKISRVRAGHFCYRAKNGCETAVPSGPKKGDHTRLQETSPKQRQEMLLHRFSALQARISVWRAILVGLGSPVWAGDVCPRSGLGSFSRKRDSWPLPTHRDASEGNCKPNKACV